MTEKIIKSGDAVVKEFIQELGKNKKLDADVVEAITTLYSQRKLTSTRLQQVLQDKRETR